MPDKSSVKLYFCFHSPVRSEEGVGDFVRDERRFEDGRRVSSMGGGTGGRRRGWSWGEEGMDLNGRSAEGSGVVIGRGSE